MNEQESSLSENEWAYLMTLPEELVKQLEAQEAEALVRQEPSEWSAELKEKMRPFADEEMVEAMN